MPELTPLGMFYYIEGSWNEGREPLRAFQREVETRIQGSISGGLADPGSSGMLARTAVNIVTPRTITGTAAQISIVNGSGVSGNPTIALEPNLVMPGLEGFVPPSGTTAQRPGSPVSGAIRYNITTGRIEACEETQWKNVIGGGTLEWGSTLAVFGQPFFKINELNDVLFQADKRFTVTNGNQIYFDGNFDSSVTLPSSATTIININVDNQSGVPAGGITYTLGSVFISFYYTNHLYVSMSLRTKINGTWINSAAPTDIATDAVFKVMEFAVPYGNFLTDIELTITTDANPVSLAAINYVVDRWTTETELPYVSKYLPINSVFGTFNVKTNAGLINNSLTGGDTYLANVAGQVLIGLGGLSRFDSAGKLGIGSTPNTPLDIDINGNQLAAVSGGGAWSKIALRFTSLGNNGRPVITVGEGTSPVLTFGGGYEGLWGTTFEVWSDISNAGAGGTGYGNIGQALLVKRHSQDGTTTNVLSTIGLTKIYPLNTSGVQIATNATAFPSLTVRQDNGCVGILTTSPLAALSVNGGVHVGGDSDPGNDNLLVDGNMNLLGYIGHPDYVSQLTKWRIDSLGAGDFRYLFADEMHVRSFIADLEQALAGGQIICKSVGVLGANFTAPAGGATATLTMRDLPSASNMAIFQSGDHVRLRKFSRSGGALDISDCWGIVTAYADQADGLQTWTFTRNGGADAGAMTAGTVVEADAIVLDYGVSGNGFYEVNAIDGIYGINSPYAQIVTWAGASPISANQTLRTRFGNLRGITAITNEYGMIAGTYAATTGQYFRASNTAFELHGINLLMWDGATNVIKLDRTAPSFAIGSPVPSAYGTGTGIWMGKDASTYKFRVGIPGGDGIFWNGTNLSVVGSVTITSGTNYAGSPTAGGAANTIVGQAATATSSDFASVTGATKPANNATVGATWGTNLFSIPATLSPPAGAGLYLSATHMGYYNGSTWRTFMDNSGNFYLGGTSGSLTWNGTTLGIDGSGIFSGSVKAPALYIGNFDNLAEDPGFERGGGTWILGEGVTVVTDAQLHSGRKALKRQYDATADSETVNNLRVDCRPGDEFYIGGWAANANGAGGTGGVRIKWYNSDNTFLSNSDFTRAAGSDGLWYLSSGTAAAPANAIYARSAFIVLGQTAFQWYFDDVYMRRMVSSGLIAIDGKINVSGASSALSIGTTPPISATVGTGIWLDRTGMYGLATNVLQAKFSAADGKITAGAGAVTLDVNGLSLTPGQDAPNQIRWLDTDPTIGIGAISAYTVSGVRYMAITGSSLSNSTDANTTIYARNYQGGTQAYLNLLANGSTSQAYANFGGSNFLGVVISTTAGDVPSAMLDARGTGVDVIRAISSHATRATIYVQATNSASQANLYFENNRGAFASYGGFLYGGSANATGNLFGISRADKMFLFADGASNLGFAIGTLPAQPLILGTNNAERMRIDSGGRVGIGTGSPATSAILELSSTAGAFLPSRMTTTQRDALTAVDGMVLYNLTTGALNYRKAGAWVAI